MHDLSENVKDSETPLAKRSQSPHANATLVCLNFKVPLRIRTQFKVYAARHNITMTELLLQIVDEYLGTTAIKGKVIVLKNELKK